MKKIKQLIKNILKKSVWYLKQLLPLTYRSFYEKKNGKKIFVVWKMWFGKTYKENRVVYIKRIK